MNRHLPLPAALTVALFLAVLHIAMAHTASARVGDDRFWSDRYGTPGANGPITAMAAHDGNLYVAGDFTLIGGVVARGIARWDGSQWWPLGAGIFRTSSTAAVNDLAVTENGTLYVGLSYGAYAVEGARKIRALARWDGARWSHPVEEPRWVSDGAVIPGTVTSVAAMGNDVVVAGQFNEIMNLSVSGLARFDGTRWHALITAPDTAFHLTTTIEYAHGRLVVAGSLYRIGGRETRMAIFDGSTWSAAPEVPHTSAIGRNYTTFITQAAIAEDAIHAGGKDADGNLWIATLANGVWRDLGDDAVNAPKGYSLGALTVHEGSLYVGGRFAEVGNGIEAYNLARWNGEYWSRVGGGLLIDERNTQGLVKGNEVVEAIVPMGEAIFVGGVFSRAGDVAASGIALWASDQWSALIGGSNSSLNALASFGGRIYAAGGERSAAGLNVAAPMTAIVDTVIPASLLPEVAPGVVRAMMPTDQHLYFGGDLGQDLSLAYDQNVVRWTGQTYSLVDDAGRTGVNGPVHAIAVDGRNVFIGGSFTQAGPLAVRNLVRWDGDRFHAVGGGVNGTIRALASHGGVIHVGGEFDTAGTKHVSNVARFNGEAWDDLGGGVDGAVHALAFDRETLTLFAGGTFSSAGAVSARSFALFESGRWSSPDGGVGGPVYAILVNGAGVYVGGHFERAGTVAANGIAYLGPEGWEALGSGINGPVRALATDGGSIVAAGSFTMAGTKPSFNVARWSKLVSAAPQSAPSHGALSIFIHPNPASDLAHCRISTLSNGPVRILLHDALGRVVRTVSDDATGGETALDLGGLPAGVYHCRAESDGAAASTRVVIVR